MKQPRLYVALDSPDLDGARELARQVDDVPGDFGYKVNLDLIILHGGPGVVAALASEFGRPIFTDTKTWNGGRTMAEVMVGLGRAGSALVNMYAHAGSVFMRRSVEALRDADCATDLYALGILTHSTAADCLRLYGRPPAEMVRFFAKDAAAAGAQGYIQPGGFLAETAGMPLARLVPGIRPAWFTDRTANAQEQTATPAEAFGMGADTIVCGSPIFSSPDPAEALARILTEVPA